MISMLKVKKENEKENYMCRESKEESRHQEESCEKETQKADTTCKRIISMWKVQKQDETVGSESYTLKLVKEYAWREKIKSGKVL